MQCPTCKSQDIGEIRFTTIASGATFHYCRRCEHRWWVGRDANIPLSAVLESASRLAKAS